MKDLTEDQKKIVQAELDQQVATLRELYCHRME